MTTDPDPGKAVVLYDGRCQFCLGSVKLLRRLDWLGRLAYRDANDPAGWPPCAEPLSRDRLLEEMHLVPAHRRRAHVGFAAYQWLAARLPLLWLTVPLVYLPGVPALGRRLYRWVARNRYHLVPCHDGQCALPSVAGVRDPGSAGRVGDPAPRPLTAPGGRGH
jgi:predicted DCC family thiol-disulfide oxidoreductase YuxK